MLKEMFGMNEGILKDLHQDHEEVSDLLNRILNTEESGKRASLFGEMMKLLLTHAQAEQTVLYRKLENSADEDARKFALEGANEHAIVERQLEQMSRKRNKASEEWTAQAKVLLD